MSADVCPNCGTLVQEGDIICVKCGTNLLTGSQIAEEKKEPVRRSQRNYAPYAIVGSLVVLGLLAAGGLLYVLLQDPVGEAVRLYQEDRLLESLEVLQPYAQDHPANQEAQLLLGKLYWQAQQFDRAAEKFDSVANNPDSKNEEAALLAILARNRLTGDTGRNAVLASLKKLAKDRPDDAQVQHLLGFALGMAGDFAGQIEALQGAVALDGNAAATRSLGLAYALSADYDSATETLESARRKDPDSGDTVAALGLTAQLAGNSGDAEALLDKALERGTMVASQANTRLGLLHMARGEFDQALPLLREAKSVQNAPPAAAFFHALCLQANGLDAEALAAYDHLSTGSGRYAGEAAVQMARIYMSQGNTSKAEEYLRRAAQAGGASARMHTIRGQLQVMGGDTGAAQQSFRSAVKADPSYAPAHLENGLQYIARGVLSEGVRELERYLSLVGEDRAGTRANEIELLVSQLKQAVERGGAAAAASR